MNSVHQIPKQVSSPNSLIGGQCQVVEVPAIPRALQSQEKQIIHMAELIGKLEQRLQPVTRMEPMCENVKEPCEPPPQGVSGTIEQNNRAIDRLSSRISELLCLLEV